MALGRQLWQLGCCLTSVTPRKPFLGRLLLYRSDLKSFLSWGITLAFPFPCCWSYSILLYLLTWSINWRKLVTGLPVKDFLKPCSGGRPTLKVLIVTSSKSPSISLNISQYLSTYTFTDSPFLMDMDSRESRGWGTLLHVMNWEQNDWVSFLKKLMEFVLSPSNHLIGIGPKLDGNTLHNRASSWEWITIFCLNWLTCSTGSVRSLYMANVGWRKRLGSFTFSIPRVKGDLEI